MPRSSSCASVRARIPSTGQATYWWGTPDNQNQMSDGLAAYYAARNESESEQRLEILLSSEAEPAIRAIVRGKLRPSGPDLEDVCADVMMDLMVRLRQAKNGGAVIENFD